MATVSPPAAASTDSLASSGSGRDSRFNRLVQRLHTSSSGRDLAGGGTDMDSSSPSTPLRYAPSRLPAAGAASATSPALSDLDDLPLERPVFESNFMRELQQGQPGAPSPSPLLPSARPPLAASHSSPAAMTVLPSPNNNNNNTPRTAGEGSQYHRISPPAARELERTRSSPAATSPLSSSSSSASLKARLVRVASSNSLFGKSGSSATSIADLANNEDSDRSQSQPQSPSHAHPAYAHRKTASLASSAAAGPSPSPRSRLGALVANGAPPGTQQQRSQSPNQPSTFSRTHAYRHSEDVRQYSRSSPALDAPSSAYGKNHASSPPLSSSPSTSSLTARARAPSPNLHALREHNGEDEEGPLSSSSSRNHANGGLFSSLSVSSFSLSRKKSVDGLSLASNASAAHLPIPEGEEPHQDDEHQNMRTRRTSNENIDEDQTAKRHSGGSIEQKPSLRQVETEVASSRPALGERYLSSDRLPSQDRPSTTAAHRSTTPGFPRHIPNASYSGTYTNPSSSSSLYTSSTALDGSTSVTSATTTIQTQRTGLISSGLSESSRRFRSAFRLNKSRAAGMGLATPGAIGNGNENAASLMGASTTTRRAMRVPLKQQQLGNEEEEEEHKYDSGEKSIGTSTVSPKAGDDAISNVKPPSNTVTTIPHEVVSHDYACDEHKLPTPPAGPHISHVMPRDSGNASRSRSVSPRGHVPQHEEEHEEREKERESARERAQLVPSLANQASLINTGPHKITVARPVRLQAVQDGTNAGALKPGRAVRGGLQEIEQSEDCSPQTGRSTSSASTITTNAPETQQVTHARTASRGRLDDLMLIPEGGSLAHPRPASRQQHHARTTSDNTAVGDISVQPSVDEQRERAWQAQPQPREPVFARRDNHEPPPRRQQQHLHIEQEEVLLIDNDKENVAAGDWYRQHREKRDEKNLEKGHISTVTDRQSENGLKPRQVLGQVRKPLQEQQGNHQRVEGGFLPEPRQQGPLPQQHRVGGKLSSSSSNGGLGYFPSDRQVVVNDYAVPTKRSGDTPPSSNEKESYQPFPKQQQQQHAESNAQSSYRQHQAGAALPPSRPPAASLPALPSLPSHGQDQQAYPHASGAPQKRAPGTVTVQGKTYTRMGLLGRGGSSKVFRVCDKDHLVYALKKIDLGRGADNETYQAFLNEISLLEALRGHDRIIQLVAHEVNEAKKSLIMVMEIGEIDLNALLQERISKSFPASMNFIRYMWEQMLEAVNVIHDEGIVHTDLKPANFVLVKGALKLIDFGIAKAIPNDTTNIARDQQIGTANYMSPEALNPHNSAKNGRVMKLGRPSDVWSLGCILYQMVYGHTPFGQIKNLAAKMNAIQTPGYAINFPTHAIPSTIKGEPLPELAVRVEDDLLAVMKSCLRYEPKRRATIPQLLLDPFLRREDSARSRDEGDEDSSHSKNGDGHVSLDLVSAIVKQTLNWSNGRQPTRGEQERFVDAILRQANGMIR